MWVCGGGQDGCSDYSGHVLHHTATAPVPQHTTTLAFRLTVTDCLERQACEIAIALMACRV